MDKKYRFQKSYERWFLYYITPQNKCFSYAFNIDAATSYTNWPLTPTDTILTLFNLLVPFMLIITTAHMHEY